MSRNTNLPFLKNLVSERGNGRKLGDLIPRFTTLLNAKRLPTDEEFAQLLEEFKDVGGIEQSLKSWKKSVAMSVTATRKRKNKNRQITRSNENKAQAVVLEDKRKDESEKPVPKKSKRNGKTSSEKIITALSEMNITDELLGILVRNINQYESKK